MARSFPARLNDVGAAVNSLANQPWLTAPSSKKVLFALAGNGATPRFVGGCVRDGLLGNPSKDLDIAIDQVPDDNMRLLQAVGVEVVPTGLKHGTITAVTHDQSFEITTLRVDVESFGRHAKVAFTDDWSGDAARRDFTINAIYADGTGDLFDPLGGMEDLVAGRVRFVGDAARRIEEDKLRILRFFRFQARFARGELDQEALVACAAAAPGIGGLSGERVRDEFLKILALPAPEPCLSLMAHCGVLQQILPDGFVLEHLDRPDDDPVRRLATIAKSCAEALARRLCLSNQQAGRLQFLMSPPARFRPGLLRTDLRRLIYDHGAEAIRDLAQKQGDFVAAARIEALAPPPFPLSGRDAIAAGIAPGPDVGKLLRAVEHEWRDSDFAADHVLLLQILRSKIT